MRCAVALCENEGRHKFPKDEARKKQWIEAIKYVKPKMNITYNSVICSDHFQLSDFSIIPTYWNNYYTGRLVSKTVVPSVFPWSKPVVVKLEPPPQAIQDTISFNPKQVKATYSRVIPTVSVAEKNHTVSTVNNNTHKTKNKLQCIVTNCENEGRHKFPKDEVRRKQWIKAIKRVKPRINMTISGHSLICSDHFRLSVFPWDKTSLEVTLEQPSSSIQVKLEQPSSPIQVKLELPSSSTQVEQPSSSIQVEQPSSSIQVKKSLSSIQAKKLSLSIQTKKCSSSIRVEQPSSTSSIQVKLEQPSSSIQTKLELPSSSIQDEQPSSSIQVEQLSSLIQVKKSLSSIRTKKSLRVKQPSAEVKQSSSSPIQVKLEQPSSFIQVKLEPPSSPIQVKLEPPSSPLPIRHPSSPLQVRQSSPILYALGLNPSGQVKSTYPKDQNYVNSTVANDIKTKKKLRCVVVDCKNRGRHRFPKNEVRRKQWIEAVKHVKPEMVINGHSQICSDHFQISDFSVTPSIWNNYYASRILRKTVIPSVFPWNNTSEDVKVEQQSSSIRNSLNFNPDQVKTTHTRVLPTVFVEEQNEVVSTVTEDAHEDPLLLSNSISE